MVVSATESLAGSIFGNRKRQCLMLRCFGHNGVCVCVGACMCVCIIIRLYYFSLKPVNNGRCITAVRGSLGYIHE